MIRITVPGRLAGKGRPRFSRKTGRAYTPQKTVKAEATLSQQCAAVMGNNAPMIGPVAVSMQIFQIPPASWSKAKRAAAKWIVGRPDADNQFKILADAANHIIWHDDAQIAKLSVDRLYTLDGPERVEITIHDLSVEPWARVGK